MERSPALRFASVAGGSEAIFILKLGRLGKNRASSRLSSEVSLGTEDGMRQACAVNLHNLVTIRQEILGRRLTQLSPRRMSEVCTALAFALGCDGNS